MEITLTIADELARLIGSAGDIERAALEALALAEYQAGRPKIGRSERAAPHRLRRGPASH